MEKPPALGDNTSLVRNSIVKITLLVRSFGMVMETPFDKSNLSQIFAIP